MFQKSDFDSFCKDLHMQLAMPLPGYEAQKKMEPPSRQQLLKIPRTEAPREGAVLIAFFPDQQGISTIMIQRSVYDGVHSGQIAFPGGRRDPSDQSLTETAIREAVEEVGVNREATKVIGSLSRLYIPPSNFDVLPVIAVLSERPALTIQPEEVTEAFFVPLRQLTNPENCQLKTIHARNYSIADVPAYCIDNRIIWGATAMIISELLAVLPPCTRL